MGCEESEACAAIEWPRADGREQAALAAAALAYLLTGGYAVRRYRPRWFLVWLLGLLAWAIVPKYFICARCENYGKPCDFFYGGKYAALFFKKQDRPFTAAGYFAEGSSLAAFQLLPVFAARRHGWALAANLLAGGLFQSLLIYFCCADCVRYSRDEWKARYCPTYKLVAGLGIAAPAPGAVRGGSP